jgi:hypothetical protein
MTGIPLRPMSGGELLDRAFQLYRSRFPTLLLIGIVFYAPTALLLMEGGEAGGEVTAAWTGQMVGLLLLAVVVATACTAALARVVDGAVGGRDIATGAGLASGLKLVPRLILLLILAYLLGIGAMIPGGLVLAFLGGASSVVPAGAGRVVLGVVGGLFALAVFAAGVIWWSGIGMLSLPAMVAENLGPLNALKRAGTLAKGHRVRITGLGLLAWLIVVLPTMGLSFMLGFGSALLHPEFAQTMSAGRLYVQQIIGVATGALTMPYLITVLVLLYYDGRVRREGYDVEMAVASLEGRP